MLWAGGQSNPSTGNEVKQLTMVQHLKSVGCPCGVTSERWCASVRIKAWIIVVCSHELNRFVVRPMIYGLNVCPFWKNEEEAGLEQAGWACALYWCWRNGCSLYPIPFAGRVCS
ncbi:hypothetical protein EMCRGX_G011029 [Ephydatia muelleri]